MVSFLTLNDIVNLRATFLTMTNDNYNCTNCKNQFSNRKNQDELVKKSREAKSCYSVSKRPVMAIKNIKFYKCVGNYYNFTCASLINSFKALKDSMDFLDESNKTVEAILFIESMMADHENKEMKKIAEQNKRGRK